MVVGDAAFNHKKRHEKQTITVQNPGQVNRITPENQWLETGNPHKKIVVCRCFIQSNDFQVPRLSSGIINHICCGVQGISNSGTCNM